MPNEVQANEPDFALQTIINPGISARNSRQNTIENILAADNIGVNSSSSSSSEEPVRP